MFLIPLGIALGADVSVKQFLLGNLLPVTLGNTFAGAICMVSGLTDSSLVTEVHGLEAI